jgi:hypothetical protein
MLLSYTANKFNHICARVLKLKDGKQIFNDYEKASGQAINYAKSEVYFSRNTPTNIKSQITAIIDV